VGGLSCRGVFVAYGAASLECAAVGAGAGLHNGAGGGWGWERQCQTEEGESNTTNRWVCVLQATVARLREFGTCVTFLWHRRDRVAGFAVGLWRPGLRVYNIRTFRLSKCKMVTVWSHPWARMSRVAG
jgi:hypothetical protein